MRALAAVVMIRLLIWRYATRLLLVNMQLLPRNMPSARLPLFLPICDMLQRHTLRC